MSGPYPHHWARIFNTPLLIAPHALDAMLPAIDRVLRGDQEQLVTGEVSPRVVSQIVPLADGAQPFEHAEQSSPAPQQNVGLIMVSGPLVSRGRYDANCTYLTGYNDISAALDLLLADASVVRIGMVYSSPGGEVAGVFDLAEKIADASKQKPIDAAVDDICCSAAFALASSANSISIGRTAIAGSIGVVMRHVDYSEWLKNEGIKITQIYAGSHKVDGNPYEPLPKPVRDKFQAEIDTLHAMFVGLVAKNRNMTEKAVIDTQADFFMGQAAIDHGLADRIETSEAMISRLVGSAGAGFPGPTASAANPSQANLEEETDMAMSIAVLAALALAEGASDQDVLAAIDKRSAIAARAEHDRIFGILALPEAEGHLAQAVSLAKAEAVTPEAAKGVLASLSAARPAANNQFAAAMTSMGNPDVGADAEDEGAATELKFIRGGWDAAFSSNDMR